jgi:hypothetical protein
VGAKGEEIFVANLREKPVYTTPGFCFFLPIETFGGWRQTAQFRIFAPTMKITAFYIAEQLQLKPLKAADWSGLSLPSFVSRLLTCLSARYFKKISRRFPQKNTADGAEKNRSA